MARTDAILVDANVVLDIVTGPNAWTAWSLDQLRRGAGTGRLLVNEVVFAEVSVGFRTIAEVEATFTEARMALVRVPVAGLFRAGKAFRDYRRQGGKRTGVLPDFFIGAHAAVERLTLLTRDTGRYRSYFPEVALISP